MNRLLKLILIKFPYLEAIIRNLYWRFKITNKLISFLTEKNKKKISIKNHKVSNKSSFSFFEKFIKEVIRNEEVILIHSSLSNLLKIGVDKNIFVENLLQLSLNNSITIATPTFPIFKNEFKSLDRFKDPSLDPEKFPFDLQSKRISTGLLGKELLKKQNSQRSKIPINNLSAIGPLADKLFEKEHLYGNSPYPCGIYSPWQELYNLDSLIIFLDLNPSHSCTFIHYLEDYDPDKWPIKAWYRKRIFKVLNGKKIEILNTFERHPKWSMSYCENKLLKDLITENILEIHKIDGIKVYKCKSKKFFNFLKTKNSNLKNHYPYYLPFISGI